MKSTLNRAVVTVGRDALVAAPRLSRWLLFIPALVISAGLVNVRPANAANFYWTGATNDNWNLVTGLSTTNWSSSTGSINDPGTLPGPSDVVNIFAFSAPDFNMELGQNFSISGLNFLSGQGSGTNAVVDGAGGFSLTLGSGGLTDSQNTGTVTISANVVLNAAQTWNNFSSNALTVSGIISGAAANNLTLGGGNSVVFTNADSYSGSTTVFTGGLTLSGNGTILNTSSITLGAGTSLTLDNNSGANNNSRIAIGTGITSKGGFINLLGSSSVSTSQTVGTLTAASGATYVNVTPGSGQSATLTFGTAVTVPSFAHTVGGTATFSPTGTIMAPNVTLVNPTNPIIGGWATIGTVSSTVSNTLNWATVSGGQVVPLATYQGLSGNANGGPAPAPLATDNSKVDFGANSNNTQVTFGNTQAATISTLFVTGTAPTGTSTNDSSQINWFTTDPTSTTAGTISTGRLTIASGGILCNDAGGTGYYDNKTATPNMAFIGPNSPNPVNNNLSYQGQVTSGFFPTATTAELDIFTTATGNLRLASVLVDPDATHKMNLVKSGPGLLDLSNGNTQNRKLGANGQPASSFSGKVFINEGILLINAAPDLGPNPAASTADAVTFNGGELRTFAGLTPNANQGWTVGTRGGTFTYTGGGTSTISNKITGVGGFTYYTRAAGGGTNELIQLGNAGGVGLADYQGPTNIWVSLSDGSFGSDANGAHQFGRISWTQNNQIPAASAMTMNVVDDTTAHAVQPNTLVIPPGAAAGTYICSVDFQGHTDHFGSLAGNLSMRNFTGTLTIGANNLSTQYDGTLYGSAGTQNNNATLISTLNVGTGTLVKVGTGTQTITGNLNYSGPTNVNGGTLRINSAANVGGQNTSNVSPITVGSAGTLAGSGTIAATVNVSGALAPSNFSGTTATTLTVTGNLTMAGGSALNFLVGAPSGSPFGSFGAADLVKVMSTGNVALNNGTTSIAVNLNPIVGSGFGPGIYDLLDSSTGSGTFTTASNTNFLLPPNGTLVYKIAPPGVSVANINGPGNIYSNPAGSKELVLVVQSNPNPPVIWTGAANDSTWNTTSVDWATDPAHAPTKYTDGALVTFDQTGTNTSITLGGATFKPSSLTFKNSAVAYTFANGTLADGTNGPTGVTKTQGGSVVFNNTNTFTGTTTISGGSITVGAAGSYASPLITVNGSGSSFSVLAGGTLTGAASLILTTTGTATFNNAAQTLSTVSGDSTGSLVLNGTALSLTGSGTTDPVISGSGSLRVVAGTTTLTNTNTYTGSTTVQSGLIQLTGNGSLANNGSDKVFVTAGTDFSVAAISRQVSAANGSYAGLGSTAIGTAAGLLGSRADIVAGTNSGAFTGGNAASVNMAWRVRASNETTVGEGGSPASPPLPQISAPLISDVIQLTGMTIGAPTPSQTDVYGLQMRYDPTYLSNEADHATGASIYLAFLNPNGAGAGVPMWQNAIAGNTGNNATPNEQNFQGSFAAFQTAIGDPNIADYIGAWGVDTAAHNVWAVVNHNSQFAVVPEPTTLLLALLGAAAVGLISARRKK